MITKNKVNEFIKKGKIELDRKIDVKTRQEAIQIETNIDILEYLIFNDEEEHLIKLSAIRRVCQLQLLKNSKTEKLLCKIAEECVVLEYRIMAVEYIKTIQSLHEIRFKSKNDLFIKIISHRMEDINLIDKLLIHCDANISIVMAHMDKLHLPSSFEEIALNFETANNVVDYCIIQISKLYLKYDERFLNFYSKEIFIELIQRLSVQSISSKIKLSAIFFLSEIDENVFISNAMNSKDSEVRVGILHKLKSNEIEHVLKFDKKSHVRRKAGSFVKDKQVLTSASSLEKNLINKLVFKWYSFIR